MRVEARRRYRATLLKRTTAKLPSTIAFRYKRRLQSSLRGKTMVRAARDRNALHREATFRLDDGEDGTTAGAEAGVGEEFALPRVSGVLSDSAPDEGDSEPDATELDTANLADRIIAAAERGDNEEMEELSALARRKVDSAAPDAGVLAAGGDP